MKFAGYDRRDDALKLNGKLLRVSRVEARRAIAPGTVLWADLIGLAVEDTQGQALGTVRDLIRAGGADVLVVTDPSGRELLLPMLDSVVRSIDTAARRIVAQPQEEL